MRRVVGTQEMAQLLGVKPHVLRYWEQEIPLIAPDRDTGGRKVYRDQDLRFLHRLRHLVIEKKYTVQGALERIIEEASPEQAPRKAAFEGLRADLLALRSRLVPREEAPRAPASRDIAGPVEAVRSDGLPKGASAAAQAPGASASAAAQAPGGSQEESGRPPWPLESLAPERLVDAPQTPPAIILRRRMDPPSSYFEAAATEMVREGELLLVTVSHLFLSPRDETPAECLPVWPESGRSLLQGAMERARALGYRLGRPARWLHLVWDRFLPEVEKQLNSFAPLYRPTLLSVPGSEAREMLSEELQSLAASPYATFLAWLRAESHYPSIIHFTPLEEVTAPFLDEELIAYHLAEGSRATARACDRGGGRWRLSGSMIYFGDTLRKEPIPLEAIRGDADTKERQVSLAHLFAAVDGVAVPAAERCLRPGRYDRGWPEELRELTALRFREWCERAGRPPEREIDPLFAENPEDFARRSGYRGEKDGERPKHRQPGGE